jgi:predicted transcriptional regulator
VLTKEFFLNVVRKYQRSINSAEIFDFYVKSNDENHFVQVRCQRKYEDSLELLIANLTSFVSDILDRLD